MIRVAKTCYYRTLIEHKKFDSKTIWKYIYTYIKELTSDSKSTGYPTLLTIDEDDYIDRYDMANILNNYILNTAERLCHKISNPLQIIRLSYSLP